MKKIQTLFLSIALLCCMLSIQAQAKNGDVIGEALNTDIVAYINHYAIPSYAVNGQSVIIAEDLRNFGFNVIWDANERTLTVSHDRTVQRPNEMNFYKNGAPGTKFADVLETDIRVYTDSGVQLTSYALNGYTMIPIEELTMFGEVNWVSYERAIKLWVDGLNIRTTPQFVSKSAIPSTTIASSPTYYPGTTTPDYGFVTGASLKYVYNDDSYSSTTLYAYGGNSDQMVAYVRYLLNNGWQQYKNNSTDTKVSYSYSKGMSLVLVSYMAKYDEVWVTVTAG